MSAELPQTTAALIESRIVWLDAEMSAVLDAASTDLRLYGWARYHLGWLDETLAPLSLEHRRRHGGKRLRGVLAILAAEALGGNGLAAAPAGAAVELVHNFSLVHDDVEDNDAERRHRPTVWKLWGVPHAINVGSNMQALVNLAALRLAPGFPPGRVLQALRVLTRAIVLMTEGQFLDMAAENAAEMSREDYFRMTGGKTAALTEASLCLGALLGSEDEGRIAAMAEFGRQFGLAFQCRDDYLGIWGDPAVTGKPVGADLERGKRSLPVVEALASAAPGTPDGRRLRRALAERDVRASLELMTSLGVAERTLEHVRASTDAALSNLERALSGAAPGPEAVAGEAIRTIAHHALQRES